MVVWERHLSCLPCFWTLLCEGADGALLFPFAFPWTAGADFNPEQASWVLEPCSELVPVTDSSEASALHRSSYI